VPRYDGRASDPSAPARMRRLCDGKRAAPPSRRSSSWDRRPSRDALKADARAQNRKVRARTRGFGQRADRASTCAAGVPYASCHNRERPLEVKLLGFAAACATAGARDRRLTRLRDFTYHERRFLKALDEEGVQFLVVGSWAPALHGLALAPADLDVLIGTDAGNVQAFLRAWDRLEPIPGRRVLRDAPAPFRQIRVTLGKGHADALTAVRGVDFAPAWERREIHAIGDLGIPVPARADLLSALESSQRPQDRERLALLQQRALIRAASTGSHSI
jgi:hypothetical protein